MKKIKGNTLCNLIGIICLIIGAGVLFRTAALFASPDMWFDELFTVEFAIKPVGEMVSLAMKDVHPPLYYIYVRLVYLLLSGTGLAKEAVTAVKIASVIPYFGILIYMLTAFRKRFGMLAAGLSFVLIITMPQLPSYVAEARMYSLAMFVVIAMFIHSMEMIACESTLAKYIHLAATTLYGIAAMYIHYYAFIAAGAVWACTYVYFLIKITKKDRDEIKKHKFGKYMHPDYSILTVCIVLSLIAYIPWMSAVFSQVGAVSQSYWIQPVTFKTLGGCIKFIFKPEFENGMVNIIYAIILFLIYCFFVGRYLYLTIKEKDTYKALFVLFSLISFVLLVAAGFVASILIKPVFVYRYMLPVLGLFWICFAIALADFVKAFWEKKSMARLICVILTAVLLFAVALRDYHMFIWEEEKKVAGMQTSEAAFDMINDTYSEAGLVCNFNQVQAILWYYLDSESILWGETEETLIGEICHRDPVIMTTDVEELKKLTEESKVDGQQGFLFVGSGNARDEIISLWEQNGMKAEIIADSCLVERYYFNIYKVVW